MRIKALSLLALAVTLTGCGSGSDDPLPPENQAPKLSAIADQTITANQPDQSVGITLSDEAPNSVVVTITSTDQPLLPDAEQKTGGQGTGRLAILTPTADEAGQTMVTITATDTAGLTDSIEFMLTVLPEQKSMQQFARTTLNLPADAEPELVNAVEFMQDAEDDDFADLFEQ
ncbi:MAG: hypothetical protein AB8G16_12730 [Gammaproteobacteria bacterium]